MLQKRGLSKVDPEGPTDNSSSSYPIDLISRHELRENRAREQYYREAITVTKPKKMEAARWLLDVAPRKNFYKKCIIFNSQ